MKIKILHVITRLELGGAQKNVLDIVSRLDKERYDVTLMASAGLLSEEAQKIAGVKIRHLPLLRRRPNPVFDLLSFVFLVYFIRSSRIAIVHTHSSKAGILGRWAAYFGGADAIVHTVHGWGFHDHLRGPFVDFYVFLERRTARITDKLIGVTHSDIERGLEKAIGVPHQYALIRYGIDPPPLKAVSVLKDSFGLDREERVVGMVACLKPQKNPLDFVRVAARVHKEMPEVKFFLIGDGVLRKRTAAAATKAGIESDVLLLGWRMDAASLISVFDVFVLTSLWEGLPFVLLEAMRWGKPVVAYDVCGLHEIIRDGLNGFLVKPGDVAALSDKVALLLKDKNLHDRMSRFARYLVSQRQFTAHFMMEKIEELYEKLLPAVAHGEV